MHCSDANCAGGDEKITTPKFEGFGDAGEFSSLVLDNNGYPVVSYRDRHNNTLRLLHCSNIDCSGSTNFEK
jgi:hypothetical protein